jgi:hypothetical protein
MSMNVSVSHHRSPPGNGKKIIDHQTSNFTQNCDIHLFSFISSNITLRVILGLVKSNIVIGFEIKI